MLQEHLREKSIFEWNVAIAAGKAGGTLGDTGHGVRMMVAPGQDAGARRRAQRRGVHVVEEQAVRGELVDVRRCDGASVTAQLGEAGIVLYDEEDVGCTFFRPQGFGPSRAGDINCPSDDAAESGSGFDSLRGILILFLLILVSHLPYRTSLHSPAD